MLRLAIALLVIALIAAVLGFGQLEGTAMYFAQVVFVVFLILAVLSFFFGGSRGRTTI